MVGREESEFQQDCPNRPLLATVLPIAEKVVAIGDVHGDVDVARRILLMTGVIDEKDRWIADPPDTVVVAVGDLIDSWRPGRDPEEDTSDDTAVYCFFRTLEKKARRAGGSVYTLLGNHEIMNARADFRYVSRRNREGWEWGHYQGEKGRRDAYRPGGEMAVDLACSNQSVLVIGSTLFAHAGVLPSLKELMKEDGVESLVHLNQTVRRWLLNKKDGLEVQTTEKILTDPQYSPFWTRVYGQIAEGEPLKSIECSELRESFQVFGINHMVVGHTPQVKNGQSYINGTCYDRDGESRLHRIDGGFSQAFSHFFQGKPDLAALVILNDKEFQIIRESDSVE